MDKRQMEQKDVNGQFELTCHLMFKITVIFIYMYVYIQYSHCWRKKLENNNTTICVKIQVVAIYLQIYLKEI